MDAMAIVKLVTSLLEGLAAVFPSLTRPSKEIVDYLRANAGLKAGATDVVAHNIEAHMPRPETPEEGLAIETPEDAGNTITIRLPSDVRRRLLAQAEAGTPMAALIVEAVRARYQ